VDFLVERLCIAQNPPQNFPAAPKCEQERKRDQDQEEPGADGVHSVGQERLQPEGLLEESDRVFRTIPAAEVIADDAEGVSCVPAKPVGEQGNGFALAVRENDQRQRLVPAGEVRAYPHAAASLQLLPQPFAVRLFQSGGAKLRAVKKMEQLLLPSSDRAAQLLPEFPCRLRYIARRRLHDRQHQRRKQRLMHRSQAGFADRQFLLKPSGNSVDNPLGYSHPGPPGYPSPKRVYRHAEGAA